MTATSILLCFPRSPSLQVCVCAGAVGVPLFMSPFVSMFLFLRLPLSPLFASLSLSLFRSLSSLFRFLSSFPVPACVLACVSACVFALCVWCARVFALEFILALCVFV